MFLKRFLMNILFAFFVFSGQKDTKEAANQFKEKPSIKVELDQGKVTFEQKVDGNERPSGAEWFFGQTPLKTGGRYNMEITERQQSYFASMTMSQVSLVIFFTRNRFLSVTSFSSMSKRFSYAGSQTSVECRETKKLIGQLNRFLIWSPTNDRLIGWF